MKVGRLFHMKILEPERWEKEVVVCPDEHQDRRLKDNKEWWAKAEASGATIIKERDLAMVLGMEKRFYELPIVKDITERDLAPTTLHLSIPSRRSRDVALTGARPGR